MFDVVYVSIVVDVYEQLDRMTITHNTFIFTRVSTITYSLMQNYDGESKKYTFGIKTNVIFLILKKDLKTEKEKVG